MRLSTIRAMFIVSLILLCSTPIARADDAATPIAETVTKQTIAGANVVNNATTPLYIALVRYILPPGTSITSGATSGPRLVVVESGELTIQSGEVNRGYLQAADAPPWAAKSTSINAVLPKDAHYIPPQSTAAFNFANEGARAAIFLDAIAFPRAPTGIAPYTTMDGVVVDPLVIATGVSLPATLVDLEIARLDISVGASLDLPASTGPRLYVIESGTVELANQSGAMTYSTAAGPNPGSLQSRSIDVAAGGSITVRARSTFVVSHDAVGTISNRGRTDLVLLGFFVMPGP